MFAKNPLKNSNQSGFTIVEVMIVLAIAGLILAIVFIAVPALQRNSRNTQRRADLGNLRAQVDTWTSNNGGKIPLDSTSDDLASIVKSTGWGHYNGNNDLPGIVVKLGSGTASTCVGGVDSGGVAIATTATQAVCEATANNTVGTFTAATTGDTPEYTVGYARDLSAAGLASIELPHRNEMHIFGEMACAQEILADGNDDDGGVGTDTYAAGHADLAQSNARAIAFVYQIEGEDNARCEDNV